MDYNVGCGILSDRATGGKRGERRREVWGLGRAGGDGEERTYS